MLIFESLLGPQYWPRALGLYNFQSTLSCDSCIVNVLVFEKKFFKQFPYIFLLWTLIPPRNILLVQGLRFVQYKIYTICVCLQSILTNCHITVFKKSVKHFTIYFFVNFLISSGANFNGMHGKHFLNNRYDHTFNLYEPS